MADNRYVQGQVARLKLNVKVAGVDENPTSPKIGWTWEDGTSAESPVLTPDDTGDFHHDLVLTPPAGMLPLSRETILWYGATGGGAAAGSGQNSLVVEPRRF